jgi:hypothetical protein
VHDHHTLRLRSIRCREADDKNQCERNLFHTTVSRTSRRLSEQL